MVSRNSLGAISQLFLRGSLIVALVFVVSQSARSEVFSTTSSKDNTLYQKTTDPNYARSNGAGVGLYLGTNDRTDGNLVRRPLIAFDVSGIAAGSTIESVTLSLNVVRARRGADVPQTVTMHRLLSDWGEGTSVASSSFDGGGDGANPTVGDATWLHTFWDPNSPSSWSTPGGDFSGTVSSSQTITGLGEYTFGSTTGLVADVQSWVDDPGTNFGWILTKDDSFSKVFASREAGDVSLRPLLEVTYTTVPEPSTVVLFGLGFCVCGLAMWHRKRRK